MSNRHLIRSIVLQSLFEWDFKEKKDNIDEFVEYDINEFAPTIEKDEFLQFLIKGVTRNIKKIDKIIKTYAPEWPINQISIIDRNILRIAIFELIYNDATPYKVIINEAIELSKNFGANNSSKFINGVLGTVFENMQKSVTNIYEIGLVIKNGDKYLVTKNDEKVSFFRFKNGIKEKNEIEKLAILKAKKEEEIKNEKEEKEHKKDVPILEKEIIKEVVSDERLDNNEFIATNDEKEKARELEDLAQKEKEEKEYVKFSKKEIEKIFNGLDYNIKSLGEINYSIRSEEKDLFPMLTKKNIVFLLINNIKDLSIFDKKGVWIKEDELLNNLEYKNLKKIIKNL